MGFDFKEQAREVRPFRLRLLFAFGVVLVLFLVLLGRLAWLQIISRNTYEERAEKNRTMTITTQGPRGTIQDRAGRIIAKNVMSYSLEIIPDQVKNLNQTIDELSEIIPITKGDRRRFRRLREDLHRLDSIPIKQDLTDEQVATFIAQQWRFPGVQIAQREHRVYPFGASGAHFLGYIGSLSQRDQERLKAENQLADYEGEREIGKVGLERAYERELHGTPGHETFEVTAGGHAVRTLALEPAKPGKNLTVSIDMNLQKVAEEALGTHRGVVIAIAPKTGEILAFVSMPTYDPNLFPGGIDPESWNELNTSSKKPLLNRAMRGLYPIGSTFKPFMALAGLDAGVTTVDKVINDTGVFTLGKHKFRDMARTVKGPLSLKRSIAISSDVYYYWLATELGIDAIHAFMKPWGFGQKTGIDLVGEQTGILPSREWKEKRFKQPWYMGDTPSIGIGQGYNAFTLLQLAHATATIANRGVVMTPHLVTKITEPITGSEEKRFVKPSHTIPLKRAHLNAVIEGMHQVTTLGTAKRVFQNSPYPVAGKTGTAQVVAISQDDDMKGKNPKDRRYQDHALFIAFAPVKNPEIAVTVLVENGGFGAATAAPVARTVMDYWLTGKNSLGLEPSPGSPAARLSHGKGH